MKMNKRKILKNIEIAVGIIIFVLIVIGLTIFANTNEEKTIIAKYSNAGKTSHTTTMSWENGCWAQGVDKSSIYTIKFVKDFNSEADYTWKYDKINFHIQSNELNIVVGKGLLFKNNMNYAFSGFDNLMEINGLELVDFSNVTSAKGLFKNCTKLETLDATKLNFEKIDSAESMFEGCEYLTDCNMLDLKFNKCDIIDYMFANCKRLNRIVLPEFANISSAKSTFYNLSHASEKAKIFGKLNTSKCKDMSSMFKGASLYDYKIAESLDTTSLEIADEMFKESLIEEINLSKWQTNNLISAKGLFSINTYLSNCILGEWDACKLQDISEMFSSCSNLSNVEILWKRPENLKYTSKMFKDCFSLDTVNINCFSNLNLENTSEMFLNCENLSNIYCESITASNSENMFKGCLAIKGKQSYSDLYLDASLANTDGYFIN